MGAHLTDEEKREAKAHIIDELWRGKSLRQIIGKKKPGLKLPSRATIYSWLNPNDPTHDAIFLDHYAQAKEDQADLHADIIQEISRKVLKGKVDPAAGRVAIDALKWVASKKKPKKYGDKLDLSLEGEVQNQIHIFHIPDNGRDKQLSNGQEES